MRVAVTGRRRPARPGAGRGARGRAVHRAVRADRRGRAPTSTSTRRTRLGALLDRDRPEVVVHAAAWTDVDGCARDPELALRPQRRRRPASSPRPCAERGIDLDRRLDERGVRRPRGPTGAATRPTTRRHPINPYGASKLAGERARRGGLRGARSGRARRSSGPPGSSGRRATTSRRRSSRAAERAARGRRAAPARRRRDRARRRTPHDLAEAIVELIGSAAGSAATHHLVNGGRRVARRLGARGPPPGRRRRRDRGRPGVDLAARLDAARAGPSSSRRRCPAASRSGRGRTALADYAPALLASARRAPASRDEPDRAPASALPRRPLRRDRPPRRQPRRRSASCGGRRRSRR